MMNTNRYLSGLFVCFATFLVSCSDADDPAGVSPLVGEWNKSNSVTLNLILQGQPVTFTEFGMTVFGLNEEEAPAYVETWLQDQVLGPVKRTESIVFLTNNQFVVGTPGVQSSQGTWTVFNNNTRLRLTASGLPLSSYEFDIISLNCPALKLRHEATIEILGTIQTYDYQVDLEFQKEGC